MFQTPGPIRRVLSGLRMLPLLLLLLAMTLWTYGYWQKVSVYHVSSANGAHQTFVLGSDGGRVSLSFYRNMLLEQAPSDGWSVMTSETWGWPGLMKFEVRRPNYGSNATRFEFDGLGFAYWDMHDRSSAYYTILIPYWFLVLLLAGVVTMQGRAIVWHRRRVGLALCPACGYDLRATPQRCPECGLVPAGDIA